MKKTSFRTILVTFFYKITHLFGNSNRFDVIHFHYHKGLDLVPITSQQKIKWNLK